MASPINSPGCDIATAGGDPKNATDCALGRGGVRCLLDEEITTLVKVYDEVMGEKGLPTRVKKADIWEAIIDKSGGEKEAVDHLLSAVRGTVYEPIVLRIKEIAFKAEGPEELNALLDSFLLIRLCKQVEANYSGIRFAGVLTVDFMIPPTISPFGKPSEVWNDYERRHWSQLHFVLNIDHRMGRGQHWTALVVRIGTKPSSPSSRTKDISRIEYFDSYGLPPPNGIMIGSRPYRDIADEQSRFLSLLRQWISDIQQEFILHNHPMGYVYNTLRHQAPGDMSNCGPYSIVFLTLRARGIPFERFTMERISTEEIETARNRLYSRTQDYHPSLPSIAVEEVK